MIQADVSDAYATLGALLAPLPRQGRILVKRMRYQRVDRTWGRTEPHVLKGYHVTAVASGTAFFSVNGNAVSLRRGGVLFTTPGCEQRYQQDKQDPPMIISARFESVKIDSEIPLPGDGHGVSVKPVLDGDVEEVREDAFAEVNVHAGIEPKRSVRTHRHNYIRIFESDPLPVLANIDNSISKETWIDHGYAERPRDPVQVYDLVLDHQERHNVAEDPRYADVRNQMEQRLQNWMQRTNDPLLQGPLVVPAGSIVTPRDECSPGGETVVLQENQTVI